MFSNTHPSAPTASPSWPNTTSLPGFLPSAAKSNPKDLLVLNLSLAVRQRLIDNLNGFSQLLHGKLFSKNESDELTKENQALVIQLMNLKVRSNEEKLLARINENGEKPAFHQTIGGPGANVMITTSTSKPPGQNFGTWLVSELAWSKRERIISSLVANFNLAILNKTHLTHECKMDLLRENDELVRLLSTLPTAPALQSTEKSETVGSSGKWTVR